MYGVARVTAALSVFSTERPSPGKCLNVALTPAELSPAANVQAAAATCAGLDPNDRRPMNPSCPTSATGARFVLIPTAASAAPVAAPSRPTVLVVISAGFGCGGAPDSRRTEPPSWSVDMRSGRLLPLTAA